jgi:hypothetical protein
MSEHTLSAVLTFALLAGGAAAIGSEVFGSRHVAPQATVHGVTLPEVTITGQRPKAVKIAAESLADRPQRVQ